MFSIEYVSYADAIGYGAASRGYVQALVAAGHRVHWLPYLNDALWSGRVGSAHEAHETERGRSAIRARASSSGPNQVAELIAATAQPVDATIRIIHVLPQFWPHLRSAKAGMHHVGVTVWETDRIPDAWFPLLASVDQIWVPCRHNMSVLHGIERPMPPVHLVPHVCRKELNPLPDARRVKLSAWLGIRPTDTVFYSINAWDPRKRLAALVDGYCRAFSADDNVVLVLKTGASALYDDLDCPIKSRDVRQMVAAITERAFAVTGRPPPRLALLTEDEIADNVIDTLHVLGDCFVTLSRCEGFGLGSFDAAAHGKPVMAVGYAGPLDYLGADWPGRIPHSMVRAEAVPGYGWFDDKQFWPQPDDAAAFAMMHDFVINPARYADPAQRKQDDIQRRFAAGQISDLMTGALIDLA